MSTSDHGARRGRRLRSLRSRGPGYVSRAALRRRHVGAHPPPARTVSRPGAHQARFPLARRVRRRLTGALSAPYMGSSGVSRNEQDGRGTSANGSFVNYRAFPSYPPNARQAGGRSARGLPRFPVWISPVPACWTAWVRSCPRTVPAPTVNPNPKIRDARNKRFDVKAGGRGARDFPIGTTGGSTDPAECFMRNTSPQG